MKALWSFLLALAAAQGAFCAATPSLVVDGFAAAALSDQATAAKVASIRRNVALVFVPGILGSKLVSPTIGPIWGDGLPNTERLKLPAALVDESAPSDVQPSLLLQYYGDQYGDAFKAVQTSAKRLNIKAWDCAYDWRRDIRSGAADLERCVSAKSSEPHILIFIAHSMGGLVTMQWNQLHESGKYSSKHLVGGIAVLGSPLEGSCEVLRMIHDGYTEPQENNLATSRAGYIYGKLDAPLDNLKNALSSFLSSGMREAILTWPGAFELTPKAATTDTDRYCVKKTASGDDSDPLLISHFDPHFWGPGIGSDLLNGANLPPNFPAVLAKAKQFREQFTVTAPRAPVYAFYSEFWFTPYKANLRPGGGLTFNSVQWQTGGGDGRVPFPDGGSRPKDWVSAHSVVHSVHGSLPTDKKVKEILLDERLPKLVPVLISYRLMKALGEDEVMLARYRSAKGALPILDDVVSGIEAPNFDGRFRLAPVSKLGVEIRETAVRFRKALCSQPGFCPESLFQTRGAPDVSGLYAIERVGGLGESARLSGLEMAQVRAQIGLAHARQGNLAMATRPLAQASADLEVELPTASVSPSGRRDLEELKRKVDRNLATSLRESGQCVAAKKVLDALRARTDAYAGDLNQNCYDRDLGIYQPLREF